MKLLFTWSHWKYSFTKGSNSFSFSHTEFCTEVWVLWGEVKVYIFSKNLKYGRETFLHGRSFVNITQKRLRNIIRIHQYLLWWKWIRSTSSKIKLIGLAPVILTLEICVEILSPAASRARFSKYLYQKIRKMFADIFIHLHIRQMFTGNWQSEISRIA